MNTRYPNVTRQMNVAKVASGMSEQRGMEEGYRILSTILAGLLLYGGIGWVGDHFLHTNYLLPLGIILGTVVSLYSVVKRHGQQPGAVEHPRTQIDREESQ